MLCIIHNNPLFLKKLFELNTKHNYFIVNKEDKSILNLKINKHRYLEHLRNNKIWNKYVRYFSLNHKRNLKKNKNKESLSINPFSFRSIILQSICCSWFFKWNKYIDKVFKLHSYTLRLACLINNLYYLNTEYLQNLNRNISNLTPTLSELKSNIFKLTINISIPYLEESINIKYILNLLNIIKKHSTETELSSLKEFITSFYAIVDPLNLSKFNDVKIQIV